MTGIGVAVIDVRDVERITNASFRGDLFAVAANVDWLVKVGLFPPSPVVVTSVPENARGVVP